MTKSADVVVVGSGISGLLVARELLAAGREVTIVERGPLRLDADSLPLEQREAELPSTRHNTEPSPREGGHGWQYGYAYGGSSLLWAGVAPRLLPSDFELHSRHGVGRDWPISYDDLVPFYRQAEVALRVAGRPDPAFPGTDAYPIAPPAPSGADRILGPLLEPFGVLPLARELAAPGRYPPPLDDDADAVERSVTILGVAREIASSPGLRVLDRTAAARLRTAAGRVSAVECRTASGEQFEVAANEVVLATHGIENPALLLRSDLSGPAVGRWLGDHTHVIFDLELAEPQRHWEAGSRDSGVSLAWAEGEWRSQRASAVVVPYNPGLLLREQLATRLADGDSGRALREELADRFARTLVVYASLEDLPRAERRVELSANRDALGIPLSRVTYPADSEYVRRSLAVVRDGLERRLAPLGARVVDERIGGLGGHMLGACHMGADGVVDENLRHRELANLHVAGGSSFPSHSALHPTTTIAALAIRLGRHLAGPGS